MTLIPGLPVLPSSGSQVVLRHGDPEYGDQYGARDVWVWEYDGTYYMHYDAAGPRGWLAALATSRNGTDWVKHGPVLDLGPEGTQDSASASYGTTYFDGERWHMFYLGTPNATSDRVKVPSFPYMTMKAEASSPRGPWRQRRDIVPFRAEPGTWYSDTASPGQIVAREGEYVMVFSGATTIGTQIYRTLGLARSTDLDGPWSVDPDPLLPVTEQIENSSLYFDDRSGMWYLFTNHVGVAEDLPPEPPQDSSEYTDAVWVYWSGDLTRWNRDHKAVALDAAHTGWSPRVVGLPSVVAFGERLALYYDGLATDAIGHGGRDIGLAWLDLPLSIERP